jgi:hypothetical protein
VIFIGSIVDGIKSSGWIKVGAQRIINSWFSEAAKQISQEQQQEKARSRKISLEIQRKLKTAYGFCADPSLTAFQNAVKVRGDTNAALYFSAPANLAFYDLTPDKRIPNIAKSVLGLNLKFIPTPKSTTSNLSQSFNQFRQDMWLKTFFGVEGVTATDIHEEMENQPKMYLKTGWMPEGGYIPDEIHTASTISVKP